MDYSYINQIIFHNNQIVPLDRNRFIIANCTVKIKLNDNEEASGFLLKFIRNNKPFYCLLTNNHVINANLVLWKKEISIINENANIKLSLKLDEEERIVKCFKEILNIDSTLVEIIPKDKIDDSHFLIPNTNYSQLGQIYQDIQVAQYPSGGPLSFSEGKILGFDCNIGHYFYHNASTQFGSSGGPIVLKGQKEVFGIHKGATPDMKYNIGIFIGNIIEIMKEYKRNGKFKEFYINGNLKYEGQFKDDEYNDENGQFYFENGDIYLGPFKQGKKHGKSILVDNNYNMKGEYVYENDVCIKKADNSNNNEPFENKINIGSTEEKKEQNISIGNIYFEALKNSFRFGWLSPLFTFASFIINKNNTK